MTEVPREVVVLGPGHATFRRPEWCVAWRVTLKGAGADESGEDG